MSEKKVNPRNFIGRKYKKELDKLAFLYQAGSFTLENSLDDKKGRRIRCYSCLEFIEESHIYFDYKEDNIHTEVRLHKNCIEKLANKKEILDNLELISHNFRLGIYKKADNQNDCFLCGYNGDDEGPLYLAQAVEELHLNKEKIIISKEVPFHQNCALFYNIFKKDLKIEFSGNLEADLRVFRSVFNLMKEMVYLEIFHYARTN